MGLTLDDGPLPTAPRAFYAGFMDTVMDTYRSFLVYECFKEDQTLANQIEDLY